MITLTDYGVKLEQLRQDKIELVRKWRNSDTFQNRFSSVFNYRKNTNTRVLI